MKTSFFVVSVLTGVDAFTAPSSYRTSFLPKPESGLDKIVRFSSPRDDHQNGDCELETQSSNTANKFDPIPALIATIITFSSNNAAYADSPDWGVFEGKTGSILHPVMMFGMLALSISTALLGFEWRRQVRFVESF